MGIEIPNLAFNPEPEAKSEFRGVVIPHHPATDEISAIVLFEIIQEVSPAEIRFWGHPGCPQEKTDEFLTNGFIPVEIGEFRYKLVNVDSAAEALVKTIGCNSFNFLTVGVTLLLSMLARRNSLYQGGYMNQFHMSLPRILRNLYEIQGYDELDIIARFKEVIFSFIDEENRQTYTPAEGRKESLPAELADLAKETRACQFAPFTPGRYLRDLWRNGEPIEQIVEKVGFWITAWNRWQEEWAKAKTAWPDLAKIQFSTGELAGLAVETDNRFIAKIGSPTTGVFVSRRSDGRTAVMTRRLDLSALTRELDRLEPGRWYYHRPTGNLINGGGQYPEVQPSDLSAAEIIGLIQRFPPQ